MLELEQYGEENAAAHCTPGAQLGHREQQQPYHHAIVLEVDVVDQQQARVQAAERKRSGGAAVRPAALGEHQPARADEEQRVGPDDGQSLVGHCRGRGVGRG